MVMSNVIIFTIIEENKIVIMDNYISVLKKYSDFESTSSRKEYWMFVLFNIIFSSITVLINPNLSALYSLLIFIPALAVTVRRLHDVGKSGWMMLIAFIPFGVIWLLILLLQKGDSDQVLNANISSSNQQSNKDESSEINNTNYSNVVDAKINEEVVVEDKPVTDVGSTNLDLNLLGNEFDQVIIDWLAEEFKNQDNIDLREDPKALQRLKEAAEKAKVELSSSAQTEINLPYITATASGPKHLVRTLTKLQFEQLANILIQDLKDKPVIEDSEITLEDGFS